VDTKTLNKYTRADGVKVINLVSVGVSVPASLSVSLSVSVSVCLVRALKLISNRDTSCQMIIIFDNIT
jgi:hypothetical protein